MYFAVVYGAIILSLDFIYEHAGSATPLLSWPALARGSAYAVMIIFILCWSYGLGQPFIYFQF